MLGCDPIDYRDKTTKAEREAARLEAASRVTFQTVRRDLSREEP